MSTRFGTRCQLLTSLERGPKLRGRRIVGDVDGVTPVVPRALTGVGIAAADIEAKRAADLNALVPRYLKVSEAERNLSVESQHSGWERVPGPSDDDGPVQPRARPEPLHWKHLRDGSATGSISQCLMVSQNGFARPC